MNYPSLLYTSPYIPWETLETHIGFSNISSHPDVTVVTYLEDKFSISIDQVHTMISLLSYKPVKESYKVVLVHPADALTLQAQQALLKTLEEPPNDTQIILITNYPQKLLPTILSRCVAISEQKGEKKIDDTNVAGIQELYEKLHAPKTTVADRIRLAETIGKSKEETLRTLQALVLYMKEKIKTGDIDAKQIQGMKQVLKAIKLISGNVNTKLVLEHVLFQIHL